MRVTLLALLLMSATAFAQTQLGNAGSASGGGFVQVSATEIDFDLGRYDFPAANGPGYYPPVKGSPFDVVAGAPTGGSWVLDVRMSRPLAIDGELATIPPQQVEYRTEPVYPGRIPGCTSTPWTGVGGGSRVVVFQGPGACRLRVAVRIQTTGAEAPGPYQGTLLWTLQRAGP